MVVPPSGGVQHERKRTFLMAGARLARARVHAIGARDCHYCGLCDFTCKYEYKEVSDAVNSLLKMLPPSSKHADTQG
jgi:NAD-dependent dihydropyrimidine dehydrogenase PreA subunit